MSKRNKIITITSISCLFLTIAIILGYGFWTGRIKFKAAGQTFNVKNYGAKGDGVTNDTTAIQNTINAASAAGTGNTVYCPAGTYRVVLVNTALGWRALALNSNMTFQMDNTTEIRLDDTGQLTNYAVLDGNHIHDVNVLGGTITGDKYTHTGTTEGEQGHGVNFYSCYNILVDGVKSQKCWGDGFNFDGNNITEAHDFTIRNCISNDNRRQGLSIQCCNIGTVTNNTFSNTLGHSPQGGIDLEPWNSNQVVTNVNITGNTMTGNVGGGMVAGGAAGAVKNDTISNNNISSNPGHGFWVDSTQNITVTNNTINSNSLNGMDLGGCSGWTVTGNQIKNNQAENVVLNKGYNTSANSTGNHFSNNIITGSKRGGISLMNSSTGNVITNNWIWSNTGSNIWEDSSSQGQNTISPNTFSAPSTTPAPTVSSITPNTGVNSGSVSVTNLAGSNFVSGATVQLTKSGQTSINASSVQVASSSKITCTLPITNAAAGAWNVVVANSDNQSATLTNGFTVTTSPPTISSITPASGTNNGSTSVTNLAGTNFVSGAAVKLTKTGQTDIMATSVSVASSSKITCTLPISGAATGTWNVVVTNPDNQSATLANGFTVSAPAPTPPAQVTGLHHTGNTTSSITWDWDDATNTTGYKVYRASDNQQLADVSTSTWQQGSLSVNTQYSVYVTAYNTSGQGPASVTSSVYTSANTPVSASHSGNSTVGITWTWQTNSNPASTQFYASDSTGNSGWVGNASSWNAYTSHTANTQYTLSVKAKNGDGEETSAVTASAYTSANPPISASHSGNTPTGITWTWSTNSNPTGTQYYASDSIGDSGWVANGVSWNTSSGHSINTQYQVSVKAKNGDNEETSAVTASAYTSANPPSGVGHLANTTTGITWTWQTNSNPAGTQFYASDSTGNSGWQTNATSWNAASGHSTNTQYTLSVKAKNGNGDETSAVSTSAYTSIENIIGVSWGTVTDTSIPLSGSGTLSNLSAGSSGIYFREQVSGTNSGWLKTNTWTKSGLTANTQYHFFMTTRNGDGEAGTEQGSYDKYTISSVIPPVQNSVKGKKSVIFSLGNQPAGTVRYRITTWNAGTTAVNYTITDDLTDVLNHATLVDAGGGTLTGTTLTYPQVSLPANGTARRNNVIKEFTVQLKPADQWPAGDTVMSNTYLGVTTNSRLAYKKVTATSLTAVNLTQNKVASTTTANPGDTITYTVMAQNQGTIPADNYQLQTDLGLIPDYSTITNKGGGKVTGNTISWNVAIGAGSKVARSFTVKVKPVYAWPADRDLVMTASYGDKTQSVEITPQTATDKVIASIKNTFGPQAGAAAGSIIRTLTLPGTIIILALVVTILAVLVYFLIRYLIRKKKRD